MRRPSNYEASGFGTMVIPQNGYSDISRIGADLIRIADFENLQNLRRGIRPHPRDVANLRHPPAVTRVGGCPAYQLHPHPDADNQLAPQDFFCKRSPIYGILGSSRVPTPLGESTKWSQSTKWSDSTKWSESTKWPESTNWLSSTMESPSTNSFVAEKWVCRRNMFSADYKNGFRLQKPF
jgi:hypothetical protein